MAQWPSRRPNRRRAIRIFPAIAVLLLAAVSWLLLTKLRTPAESPTVAADERDWLSPELYGARSIERAPGEILVDRPDSLGPLTVVIPTPGTPAEDWSALQALFERQGLASVVLALPATGGHAALRSRIEELVRRTRERGRPIAALTISTSLDSLLDAIPPGHPFRTSHLAIIAPHQRRESGWRRLLTQLHLRREASDDRLGEWVGPTLVARVRDEPEFDSAAAARLARERTEHALLSGGGFDRAPKHPADDEWLPIVRFLAGMAGPSEVVVGGSRNAPDSTVPLDSPTVVSGGP